MTSRTPRVTNIDVKDGKIVKKPPRLPAGQTRAKAEARAKKEADRWTAKSKVDAPLALRQALMRLANVHTMDGPEWPQRFVIRARADPDDVGVEDGDYYEAWRAVRSYLDMDTL